MHIAFSGIDYAVFRIFKIEGVFAACKGYGDILQGLPDYGVIAVLGVDLHVTHGIFEDDGVISFGIDGCVVCQGENSIVFSVQRSALRIDTDGFLISV